MLTKENFNESHKLRGMEVEGVDTCMLKEYLEKTTVTTNRFSLTRSGWRGLVIMPCASISNRCWGQAIWPVLIPGFIISLKRHGC